MYTSRLVLEIDSFFICKQTHTEQFHHHAPHEMNFIRNLIVKSIFFFSYLELRNEIKLFPANIWNFKLRFCLTETTKIVASKFKGVHLKAYFGAKTMRRKYFEIQIFAGNSCLNSFLDFDLDFANISTSNKPRLWHNVRSNSFNDNYCSIVYISFKNCLFKNSPFVFNIKYMVVIPSIVV